MTDYLLICSCGHKMKVPQSYMGKTAACVKCKKQIRITAKNTRPMVGTRVLGTASKSEGAGRQEKKRRIGELLVDGNLITPDQLNEALRVQKESGRKIGETLLSLGYIDVKTFAGFLARQPGIASIDLSNYEISRDLLALIPKEFAREHDVFPIDRLGSLLTVGMACPLDSRTIKELEEITKLRVKALLCPLDDIKAVINCYYPDEARAVAPPAAKPYQHLEGAIRLENVAALIREIGSLPALPDTVQRVQKAMKNPEVSIRDVVKIVQTDPPVAAKILSVANSAAYGFPNRVDSVSLAATLLGLNETCSLLMSLAVADTLGGDNREFWTESMACARVAATIARTCGKTVKSGVYAAGLLHDIGRAALWQVAPQRYAQVPRGLMGKELVAEEERVLGLSHPEAGFELASNWGLPVEIAEPVRFHHSFHYAEQAQETAAIVSIAAALVDYQSAGKLNEDVMIESCGEAMTYLGADYDTIAAIGAEVAADAAEPPEG